MIHYVIFSKNRAAQLDLLLRSIDSFCEGQVVADIIYKATNQDFHNAYEQMKLYDFVLSYKPEHDFRAQVIESVQRTSKLLVGFLTDDSVFYRPLGNVGHIYAFMQSIGCYTFSPRNGLNADHENYWSDRMLPPLELSHTQDDLVAWDFTKQSYCYGYGRPISLDGHFHTQAELLKLITESEWSHPRALDAVPVDSLRPYMASYRQNILVNISVNLSYDGYADNWGKKYSYPLNFLNQMFLQNKRIDLNHVLQTMLPIVTTHTEAEFRFT